MEIAIIKRETTGSGPVNVFTENETIAKYEIMDGAPVKGMDTLTHLSMYILTHLSLYVNSTPWFGIKYIEYSISLSDYPNAFFNHVILLC